MFIIIRTHNILPQLQHYYSPHYSYFHRPLPIDEQDNAALSIVDTVDMEEILSGEVYLVVRQLQGVKTRARCLCQTGVTEGIQCAASHVIFRLAARGDIEVCRTPARLSYRSK